MKKKKAVNLKYPRVHIDQFLIFILIILKL